MAENQLPVLTLDIDEEKIRQLNEISEKFKAAFGVGPSGNPLNFPVPAAPPPAPAPIPNTDSKSEKNGKGKPETEFDKFLKKLNKDAQKTLKTFGLINRTLTTTTSTLTGLFTSTLSWGTKLIALTVGGPLGFGLLARQATSQYRSSQALNITTGQMQAAKNVYGPRISGTESILQNLAAAQNDPGNPNYSGLLSLGINPQDGAAENMPKFMTRVAALLKQYKKTGVSQAVLRGFGLENMAGVGTFNQIAANGEDVPALNQAFVERSKYFDSQLSPETQKGYQGVYSNLSDNADQIMNTFLSAVSRLNGPITDLSDSLTKSIQSFISGKNGKALFDSVGRGLESIAKWIGGDSFQDDLTTFTACIKKIVVALGDAITWIAGNIPGVKLGAGDSKDPTWRENVKNDVNPVTGKKSYFFDGTHPKIDDPYAAYKNGPPTLHASALPKWQYMKMAGKVSQKYILPGGLLNTLVGTESSWNPYAQSGSGAMGLGQMIPETVKAYGLSPDDVWKPEKSLDASGRYLKDNLKRYNGDIAKTLAQYNGGNVAVGKNNSLNLKKETVDYLLKILPQVQGGVDQHPGIMNQLLAAHDRLATSPKDARATIQLDINQMPGSDISAQVKGNYVPR